MLIDMILTVPVCVFVFWVEPPHIISKTCRTPVQMTQFLKIWVLKEIRPSAFLWTKFRLVPVEGDGRKLFGTL